MKLSQRIKNYADASGNSVPIGSIIAYHPGYFGAAANAGGFTVVGPGTNTVAGVNVYLPANWRVCDGTAPNDSESPIFNSAAKFLPDLTGQRFISGNTAAGVAAGANSVTLSSANLPVHTHAAGTLVGNASTVTGTVNISHTHSSSSVTGTVGGSDGTHYHTQGDFNVGAGGPVIGSRGDSYAAGSYLNTNIDTQTLGSGHGHSHSLTATGQTLGTTNVSLDSGSAAGQTISGSTGNGGFANTAVSILPQYLQVFYITRIK